MKLFDKCSVCGGDLVAKEVENVLKRGTNTAVVKVKAGRCAFTVENVYMHQKPFPVSKILGENSLKKM